MSKARQRASRRRCRRFICHPRPISTMPKKNCPSTLKTGKLTPASFLDAIVRLGFATAEQVAAAALRLRPIQVPGAVIQQAEALAAPEGDPASLNRTTVTTDRDRLPLRLGRELYTLAPSAPASGTHDLSESMSLAVIASAVADVGTNALDGVKLRKLYLGMSPTEGREMLGRLLSAGHLTMTLSRVDDDHICVKATPEGLEEWTRRQRAHRQAPLAPARHPRVDHPVHHLLAVEAALEVMAAMRWTLVTLRGDPDLRSEAWSEAGQSRDKRAKLVEALPDAELVALDRSGRVQTMRIEIITARYDAKELKHKFSHLDKGTEVFAPTEATAKRVLAAGWSGRVHILDGRRYGASERDW